MRLFPRGRPKAALLGALTLALASAAVGFGVTQAATPSIIAVDPYSWQANGSAPAAVAIVTGEEVKFSYPSGASRHYPVLHSGPVGAPPDCVGLPTGEANAGPGWSGSCKFTQAGTYVFYCGVHGSLMTATVTVSSAGEPTTTIEAATQVGEHDATLNGLVNPSGHMTTYLFEYGTTTSYGQQTSVSEPVEGSADVTASAPVSGLAAGTTYHYRLVATNEKGTSESGDATFTTTGPPSASTDEAGSVTEAGAALKGGVNPDGRPTTYLFEWGTTTSYGQRTAEAAAGEDHLTHAVSTTLTGLAPSQTYHFRIVAKSTSGEAVGADRMFTTLAMPPSPPLGTEPPPVSPPSTPSPPSPSTTPLPRKLEEAPSALAAGSLRLEVSSHGGSLRGSVLVSAFGAGGRLEVDLLASSASLGLRGRAKQVVVGRFARATVGAGRASFSVALNARGKSALRHRRRLPVIVKIALTPRGGGAAVVLTKRAVLRA